MKGRHGYLLMHKAIHTILVCLLGVLCMVFRAGPPSGREPANVKAGGRLPANVWAAETETEESLSIGLTDMEKMWIREHPVIRLAPETSYAPFSFVDAEGKHQGLSADILALLEQKIHLKFHVIESGDLAQNLEKAKHREVDVLTSLKKNPERSRYLLFTKPYANIPAVIIVRKENTTPLSLEKMQGLKIAVGRRYGIHDYLVKKYGNLKLAPLGNDRDCLRRLSLGDVDAAIVDMASASYIIKTDGITNLRMAGDTDFIYDLSLASRNDWPMLHQILEKGLTAISDEERLDVYDKWVRLENPPLFATRTVWIVLAAATGSVLLAVMAVIAWNMTLKKQVRQKTEALKREFEERIKAEESAAASQKLLKDFSDNSASLLYAFDLDGRFLLVNRRFADLFRVPADALIGKKREFILPPEIADSHRNNDLKVIADGKPLVFEEENDEPDGKHIYLSVKFPLTDQNGQLQGVGGISTDITERKKAETELAKYRKHLEEIIKERTTSLNEKANELERSQQALQYLLEDVNEANAELKKANKQLKELDRLKSMFIASMSHELRTPLNSIIGFSGILLQGLAGDLNNEQRDQLSRVSRAGKHLLALITDVIDVSKIEAGKVDVYTEAFELGRLIDEALESVRSDADDKGLALESSVPGPLFIKTDRRRLLQCMMNLLSNAVKYSEQGTVIVSVHEEDGWIVISVEDTGIGISEKDLPLLFSAFTRLESHLKIKTPGTGLGLYLTKKIITELLGGEVFVESKEGVGSRFGIKVPKVLEMPKVS